MPPLQVNVTVSAESARRIHAAVRTLKRSDDPLLAKIAEEVEDLANALAAAAPGRVFTAGPLIDTERLIDLDRSFVVKFSRMFDVLQ